MTDLEYTFDQIHEVAQKIADLTKPENRELGVGSWFIVVGELMERLDQLKTVQRAPK